MAFSFGDGRTGDDGGQWRGKAIGWGVKYEIIKPFVGVISHLAVNTF